MPMAVLCRDDDAKFPPPPLPSQKLLFSQTSWLTLCVKSEW
jgi:hypothetical protein